jgi:type IV secretion system protein VirB9
MHKLFPFFLAAALISAPALAERAPRAISSDSRIKQVAYTPDQVFEVKGTFGFVTTIQFADTEDMKGVFVGDSVAWQIAPRPPKGNRLFIKPVEENAVTNLTVVTALQDGSQRTYLFELSTGKKTKDTTFIVRFVYPRMDAFAFEAPATTPAAKGASTSAPKRNADYGVSGSTDARMGIRLRSVYDDGQFTSFHFEPGSDIPAIYVVEANGTEATVNQRREGDALVVEKTALGFTLRRGDLHLCVRNNKRTAEDKARLAQAGATQTRNVLAESASR